MLQFTTEQLNKIHAKKKKNPCDQSQEIIFNDQLTLQLGSSSVLLKAKAGNY